MLYPPQEELTVPVPVAARTPMLPRDPLRRHSGLLCWELRAGPHTMGCCLALAHGCCRLPAPAAQLGPGLGAGQCRAQGTFAFVLPLNSLPFATACVLSPV